MEMIIGVLAVLKAGGAYVPMDAGLPEERLAYMVEDSRPAVVLTKSAWTGRLVETNTQIVLLDSFDYLAGYSAADPGVKTTAEMAAYVIYTSGSTGRPKGVVIEQRQLLNYVHAVTLRAEMPSGSFAMLQPLAVDSSLTVLFSSLCHGGTLHMITEEIATDPALLKAYFRHTKIDCLKI